MNLLISSRGVLLALLLLFTYPALSRGTADILSSKLEKYLSSYGYLPSSGGDGPFEVKPLRTESQIRSAIRNLQYFAGLKATGKVDKNTLNLLSKPRCGVTDISHSNFRNKRSLRRAKRDGNIQGERWSTHDLTWNLKPLASKTDSSGIEPGVIRRELTSALSLWSADSALRFKEIHGEDKADIEVSFERLNHKDGYPFDGPGSVLAHAFFPGDSRGGDIHFDAEETWSQKRASHLSRDGVASIYGVALHEIGHSLGLSHSPRENSIMFPWYSESEKLSRLPLPDREAVQQLYGKSQYRHRDETLRTTRRPTTTTTTPRRRRPSTSVPKINPDPQIPRRFNKCNTSFDAVGVIRSEVWAFKGGYFWRIHDAENPPQDPTEISSFWYTLPRRVKGIDALYERSDHRILMFIGAFYYVLKGNTELEAGPLPLTDLGLPPELKKVDGAFRWGWNSKTFFFAGNQYWRFDDDVARVELDYPRNISKVWLGVPSSIDSVFTAQNGKTYFFKDGVYFQFNDQGMKVEAEFPISSFWKDCEKGPLLANPFAMSSNLVQSKGSQMSSFDHSLMHTFFIIILLSLLK